MSLSDEIEAFLGDDITGCIERIAWIARPAGERRGESYRLTIAKNPRPEPGLHGWPWRYVEIDEITPDDLRAVADGHDATAAEWTADAAELRQYADDLESGSDRGVRLAEHLRVMREERERRTDEHNHALEIARGEGGVMTVFDGMDMSWTLFRGGILTLDDARAAMQNGSLLQVKGIGPARFAEVARRVNQEAEK